MLLTLQKEYDHDEDWCEGDKSDRVDKVIYIAQLVKRHQDQKDLFMEVCACFRDLFITALLPGDMHVVSSVVFSVKVADCGL